MIRQFSETVHTFCAEECIPDDVLEHRARTASFSETLMLPVKHVASGLTGSARCPQHFHVDEEEELSNTSAVATSSPPGSPGMGKPSTSSASSFGMGERMDSIDRLVCEGEKLPIHAMLTDIIKLIVLVGNVAFLSVLILHHGFPHILTPGTVMSSHYLDNGFCVRTEGPVWQQGHATSFYGLFSMSIVMYILVAVGRKFFNLHEVCLRPMAKNALSATGHSMGHLTLALLTTDVASNILPLKQIFGDDTIERTPTQRMLISALSLVALQPVWLTFARDKKRSARTTWIVASCHNLLQVFVLPWKFFFVHVLMGVVASSSLRALRRPAREKTLYYAMEAFYVDFYIMIMSWVEAVKCDTLLNWPHTFFSGHLFFDQTVPVGFTVFWLTLVLFGLGRAPTGSFAKKND